MRPAIPRRQALRIALTLLVSLATFLYLGFLFAVLLYKITVPPLVLSRYRERTRSPVDIALDGSWKDGLGIQEFNSRQTARIEACRAGEYCPGNQSKLILLGWGHFGGVLKGIMQGESVWCDAMMDAMHALGYTMIFADTTADLLALFRRYHEHVTLILWQDTEQHSRPCLQNSTCVYTDSWSTDPPPPPNSTHVNIPIWKIFNMNWWKYPTLGPGAPFTLSPENYTTWPGLHDPSDELTYIGYSLEKTCLQTPFVSFEARPKQVYILAKFLDYFVHRNYILPSASGNVTDQFNDDWYSTVPGGVKFLGQFKRRSVGPEIHAPPGIDQIPHLERPEFQKVLASSRALMGIGAPALSPSPWEALCLGVPFIHPIVAWDPKNPDDRTKWRGQHDAIVQYGLDEPYVYHVKIGDREGLERAIQKAMQTPIDRYIPPMMKMEALISRVRTLLETDWRPIAHHQMHRTGYKPIR